MSGKHRKDEDDVEDENPFSNIQKSVVLKDARIFNAPQLNAQECVNVLTMLLYLLSSGEHFYGNELTDVFFGVTKLFQSQDVNLRRLVYLVIKEIGARIGSDESLIVCACLSKDMTSQEPAFRGNAIKVLSKVMDPSMVGSLDRFLKQAIVDRDPFIVSSTLVAGHRIAQTNPDVVKRWTNELQEALTNKASPMAQFHALSLLYTIKRQDRLAISKVVSALCKNPPKGALSQCLLIRIITSLLRINCPPGNPLLKYLHDCLQQKNFIIVYEAAKNICSLENLSSVQVAPAIQVLSEFLSSPIPVQRFAAVKSLSQIVGRFPLLVSHCSSDLEHLLTDPNRSTATLAITTLLKTGVESNVDRLMKSIGGFMGEISDEYKIVLVESLKMLCLKFPHKYPSLMRFLSTALREEGGLLFKRAIVDAILTIVEEISEAQETGLEHFCEYIEDCEFPELSIKILHFLGERGPKTNWPAKYIRFVFNRVILEQESVRAAAVTSLGKFGAAVPELRENVLSLLRRCIHDNDDEVRDRAVFFMNLLNESSAAAKEQLAYKPACSFTDLELSLQLYLEQSESDNSFGTESFSFTKHLVHAKASDQVDGKEEKKGGLLDVVTQGGMDSKQRQNEKHLELLNTIPELAELGELFCSSDSLDLTEQESEYFVSCVKHMYPEHVVFQFNVENKMDDLQLSEVTVELEGGEEDGWVTEFSIPETEIKSQESGVTFVCVSRPDEMFRSGPIQCVLKFVQHDVVNGEVDDGEGDEDEYPLEEVDVAESDFMKPASAMSTLQFRKMWESMGDAKDAVRKFGLGMNDLQEAVNAVMDLLGMRACENSDEVPENAQSHAMNMAGKFFGGVDVLARAGFMLDPKAGVTLKIAVRSSNDELNALLVQAIR